MSGDQIQLGLDPQEVLKALSDMSSASKKLAKDIEDALGKQAVNAIDDLEEKAENGTNKIQTFFRNLGQRVKEDLKTAFDASGILAGAKFGKDLGEGVKQVFEMERAFDRLNNRLRLSNDQLNTFKKNIGSKVAGTGQELKDVLPGVETAASRGGVKNAGQLANIGESLGQVRAATGEDTQGLSETVVEILKNQGQKVTDKSYRETLDAIQGTRVSGAFNSAGDAAHAINNVAPYAKKLGLNTRELGGLASVASKSGESGQDILRQLAEQATTPGGKDKLNAIFGQKVFNNGKLDAKALGSVNTDKFGQYSQQVMEQATGISGASGADLKRFIDAFKEGTQGFDQVTQGANETAAQFDVASDNLATKIDKFKENLKNSARTIGDDLAQAGNDFFKGDFKKGMGHMGDAAQDAHDNKGTIIAGLGLTLGAGLLAGGGINRLLSKLPGGGLAAGMAKGQLAKAAGVQPVYVTNASEIGEESAAGGDMTKGFGGGMGAIAKSVIGSTAKTVLGVGVAWEIGSAVGDALMKIPALSNATNKATDWVFDKVNGGGPDKGVLDKQNAQLTEGYNQRHGTNFTPEQFAKAVEDGTLRAQAQKKVQYTNPSAITGRGKGM